MTTAVQARPRAQERRPLKSGEKLGPLSRFLTIERAKRAEGVSDDDLDRAASVPGLDLQARTLELTFSSEEPVERWFGFEILDHSKSAADLSRLNDGAPLLFNHNMDDVIGVVEKAWIGPDRKGHAIVRFASSERAQQVLDMVAEGVLRNVSFMYTVDKYRIDSDEEDPYYDPDATYTATAWRCYEISIVSVPADPTVGVGRALSIEARSVEVEASRAVPTPATADLQPSGESMFLKRTPVLRNAVVGEAAPAGGGAAPAAAASAAGADPVVAERQRVTDIVALCRKHNVTADKTQKMIADGVSIGEARGLVLDGLLAGGQRAVASLGETVVDLTPKEQRQYSLLRAIGAIVNKGDWSKAGFEREVSDEIAKRMGKDTAGFYMPTNLPFAPSEEHLRAWRMQGGDRNKQLRAPYLVGTAGQGGNLVATNLLADNFIEVLRNASVTAQLGARYLTDLVGKVDIPRQNGVTGMTWVGESTAPNEGEATFDKVSLTPKTVAAWSQMSRLMLLQATPAIEMLAREDLLAQVALAVDLAALSGSGAAGQPLGIVNQSGVGSIVGGANGANLTLDHIIQLKTAPKVANVNLANMAFALNWKSVGYLETLKSTTGAYLWANNGSAVSGAPATLKGESFVSSNQLRSNLTKGTSAGICSELLYGNWRELLIGMWGVMEIAVNPYDSTGFKTGDLILRVMQTVDVGVRHGASFSVMSDALTPGF